MRLGGRVPGAEVTSSRFRVFLADVGPASRVTARERKGPGVKPEDTVVAAVGKLVRWVVASGLRGAVRLVLRFPRTSLAVLSAYVLVDVTGRVLPLLLSALLLLSAGAWRLADPVSFRLWLGWRVSAWWRRWAYYAPRWGKVMRAHDLATVPADGVETWPRVLRVRSTAATDSVLVRLRDGQSPESFEVRAEPLAHAFRSEDVRVRVAAPGRVWLDVRRRDLLAPVVPALPVPTAPNLSRLEIGLRDDGLPWPLRLLGTHVLVAGATDSGKGSVLQSILRAVAPLVASGVVELWGVDPKGGMELFPLRPMFYRLADDSPAEMAQLLTDFGAVTRTRSQELKRAGLRKFTPSVETPFRLGVVDEFAFLSAYQPDHRLAGQVDSAVQVVTSQGRAPGSALLVCVQDPSKDVVPYRQLFPTRIGMRLDGPRQVEMVLGPEAWERGARCEEIPESAHGVGYVKLEGRREPFRVRAAYPTDRDIAELARDYPAPPVRPVPRPPARPVADTGKVEEPYLTDDELTPEWRDYVRSQSGEAMV